MAGLQRCGLLDGFSDRFPSSTADLSDQAAPVRALHHRPQPCTPEQHRNGAETAHEALAAVAASSSSEADCRAADRLLLLCVTFLHIYGTTMMLEDLQ